VKPIGENGTYLQAVKNRGYKVTRNSTVTVEVGGQTKTFKQGDHVTFPLNGGGKQTVTFTGVQLIGTSSSPVAGLDLKGKLAVWMNPTVQPGAAGAAGPRAADGRRQRRDQCRREGRVGLCPAPPPPSA
jgi:hypothetical protein